MLSSLPNCKLKWKKEEKKGWTCITNNNTTMGKCLIINCKILLKRGENSEMMKEIHSIERRDCILSAMKEIQR